MSTQQNDNYMTKFNPPDTLTELLVKRLNADIQNGTSYVLNEIEDELKYVFGEDWRKFLSNSSLLFFKSKAIDAETGHFEGNSGIALSLLMLKRGYVYNNGRCLLYSKSSPKSDCGSEFYYTNEHAERACKLIEDEVHKKHPELPESFYIGSQCYEECKEQTNNMMFIYWIALGIFFVAGMFWIMGWNAIVLMGVFGVCYILCMVAIKIKNCIDVKYKNKNKLAIENLAFLAFLLNSVVGTICGLICVMNI